MAHAQEIDEPIFDSVMLNEEGGLAGLSSLVEFSGAIPNSVSKGDTAVVSLPDFLTVNRNGVEDILADDGSVIASVTTGDSGHSVIFTFTDYVDKHVDTTFSGVMTTRLRLTDPEQTDYVGEFTQAGRSFPVEVWISPGNSTKHHWTLLQGNWMDLGDRGTATPDDAIRWRFETPRGDGMVLQGRDIPGVVTDFEMVMTPFNGADGLTQTNRFNCESLEFWQYQEDDHLASAARFKDSAEPLPADRYELVSCSDDKIVVKFPEIPEGTFYAGTVLASVMDTDSSVNFYGHVRGEGRMSEGRYQHWSERRTLMTRDLSDGHGQGEYLLTPDTPDIAEAECVAPGEATEPSLVIGKTPGVAYNVETQPQAGNTVTVTASATDGYRINPVDEQWSVAQDGRSAQARFTFADINCDEPVAPALPEVTEAQCSPDGEIINPELAVIEQDGVTYEIDGELVPGSRAMVTAVPDTGYELTETDGWKINENRSATRGVSFDDLECDEPEVVEIDDAQEDGSDDTEPEPWPETEATPDSDAGTPDQLEETGATVTTTLIIIAGMLIISGAALMIRRRMTG